MDSREVEAVQRAAVEDVVRALRLGALVGVLFGIFLTELVHLIAETWNT